MVACLHIKYSTYQFSEESLRFRKKRGPESVNELKEKEEEPSSWFLPFT